jgi:hypothetical protein
MEKRVVQSKDAIWRRIGDDIVVINDDGRSTHVLNKTAALIWEMCDGKYDIDEITSKICERFDVSFKEAQKDVSDTVKILTNVNIMRYIK